MSVHKNNKGFTLIEFLVAVVIMTVGLLGLLQAVNLALSTNVANNMRNQATVLADQMLSARVAELSTTDSSGFATFSKNSSAKLTVLNAQKRYSSFRTETLVGTDGKSMEVNMLISWKHKNVRYTHNASTVISKR